MSRVFPKVAKKLTQKCYFTAIDAALETLNTAWGAASQEMYAAGNDQANPMNGAGFDGGNSNPSQSQPTDGDVSDVPYEEVK